MRLILSVPQRRREVWPVLLLWCFASTFTIVSNTSAFGGNAVEIESQWVMAGAANVEIGIYLTNSDALSAIVLPLEIRSVHIGSFIRRSLDIQYGGRLADWAGDEPPFIQKLFVPYRTIPAPQNSCPTDSSGLVWRWMANDSLPDFMGEEALLYFFTSLAEWDQYLQPGSDGLPGESDPSMKLVFDVTEVGGAFVIDTTCIAHNNRFSLLDDNVEEAPVFFQRAVILIGCNAECHGDPNCDGMCNIVDLVKSIAVAFKGASPVIDPDPRCPVENTDVNCDLVTNAVDIVKMINVQYRMASINSEFCKPCDHIPRTGNPKEDVRTPYFRNNGS